MRPSTASRAGDGHTMGDSMREIRAMILLSLPYPPLPVATSLLEADDGRLQDEGTTTSHTFLARCLQGAVERADPRDDEQRRARQTDVLEGFLADVGKAASAQDVYALYCRCTVQYIATYFPAQHNLGVVFRPLEWVARGDPVHRKMAEYLAAQSILYEDEPPVSAAEYARLDYPTLLMRAHGRLAQARA